jgi:hypothetical protein
VNVEPDRKVVAARKAKCVGSDVEHVTGVKLGSGAELSADDLVSLIDAGRKYFMEAPAHMRIVDEAGNSMPAAGFPILVQARDCTGCHMRVPFA